MRKDTGREVGDFIEDAIKECDYLLKRSGEETFKSYINSEDLKRSFVRSLEIIGESVKNIPDELKSGNIPWKDIIGLRNKIAHGYFSIDHNIVWNVVRKDIEPLRKELILYFTKAAVLRKIFTKGLW